MLRMMLDVLARTWARVYPAPRALSATGAGGVRCRFHTVSDGTHGTAGNENIVAGEVVCDYCLCLGKRIFAVSPLVTEVVTLLAEAGDELSDGSGGHEVLGAKLEEMASRIVALTATRAV